MLSRTPTVRAILRTPASAFRPASQPSPQSTRSFSRLQYRTPTPPIARPSLSVTYRALPIHLQTSLPATLQTTRSVASTPASTAPVTPPTPAATQWTHSTTAYSYSSVRTFTSSRTSRTPINDIPPHGQTTSPEAAQRIEQVIEEISELYGTAYDEFEIASEETENNTTYAEDDRIAMREELDKLIDYYTGIIEGGDKAVAEEVKRRIGGKVRELEQAVLALEEQVTHGD